MVLTYLQFNRAVLHQWKNKDLKSRFDKCDTMDEVRKLAEEVLPEVERLYQTDVKAVVTDESSSASALSLQVDAKPAGAGETSSSTIAISNKRKLDEYVKA